MRAHVGIRIYLEYSVSTDDGWQCRLQCHTADQHYNSLLHASESEGETERERKTEKEYKFASTATLGVRTFWEGEDILASPHILTPLQKGCLKKTKEQKKQPKNVSIDILNTVFQLCLVLWLSFT